MFGIAAISSAAVAQVTRSLKPTPSPLDLTVRTDRQTYRMSDTMKMETRLLNTGNEGVCIWDCTEQPMLNAKSSSFFLGQPSGLDAAGLDRLVLLCYKVDTCN